MCFMVLYLLGFGTTTFADQYFNLALDQAAVPKSLADQNIFNRAFVQDADPLSEQSSLNPNSNPAAFLPPPEPNPFQTQPDVARKMEVPFVQSSKDSAKIPFTETVQTFANNFINKLQMSPVYVDAFSVHKLSRQRAGKFFYDWVYNKTKEAGDPDPTFTAYTVSQAVKNNYKGSTNLRLMEVYAYTVGELLYLNGYLTTENVLDLSNKYYQATADAIDAVRIHSPHENLKAVASSFRNFLNLYNIFSLHISVSSVFDQVYYTLRDNS